MTQQSNLSLEGNWNTFTENGLTQSRTHAPNHEVTSVASNATTHDVKGNIASKPSSLNPADTCILTWDFDNRLTSVDTDSDGALDATYTYDATGRRVTKNNTVFVCNSQQVMAEYPLGTAATSPTEQYVYGTYVDEPVVKDGTGGLVYYHRNQQRSVIGLTDASGAALEHYGYGPTGKMDVLDSSRQELSGSAFNNTITFTSRPFEPETRLHFFRARYYDSNLGRFLSSVVSR